VDRLTVSAGTRVEYYNELSREANLGILDESKINVERYPA
jgi:hypothetical protein